MAGPSTAFYRVTSVIKMCRIYAYTMFFGNFTFFFSLTIFVVFFANLADVDYSTCLWFEKFVKIIRLERDECELVIINWRVYCSRT